VKTDVLDRRLIDLLGIESGAGADGRSESSCRLGLRRRRLTRWLRRLQPDIVRQAVDKLRRLTSKPINTNFFATVPRADRACDNWRNRLALS
jgi:hypothetical protein